MAVGKRCNKVPAHYSDRKSLAKPRSYSDSAAPHFHSVCLLHLLFAHVCGRSLRYIPGGGRIGFHAPCAEVAATRRGLLDLGGEGLVVFRVEASSGAGPYGGGRVTHAVVREEVVAGPGEGEVGPVTGGGGGVIRFVGLVRLIVVDDGGGEEGAVVGRVEGVSVVGWARGGGGREV